MKKISILILSMLCLVFLFASCGKCEHEYDEGKVTTEATCTEAGVKTFTCTKCGETKTEEIAAGHKTTKVDAIASTCMTAGTMEHYTCSVCNKNFKTAAATEELTTLALALADHDIEAVTATTSTCKTQGTAAHFACKVCKKLFTDNAGTTETTADAIKLPLAAHTFEIASANGDYKWVDDGESFTAECLACEETIYTVNYTPIFTSNTVHEGATKTYEVTTFERHQDDNTDYFDFNITVEKPGIYKFSITRSDTGSMDSYYILRNRTLLTKYDEATYNAIFSSNDLYFSTNTTGTRVLACYLEAGQNTLRIEFADVGEANGAAGKYHMTVSKMVGSLIMEGELGACLSAIGGVSYQYAAEAGATPVDGFNPENGSKSRDGKMLSNSGYIYEIRKREIVTFTNKLTITEAGYYWLVPNITCGNYTFTPNISLFDGTKEVYNSGAVTLKDDQPVTYGAANTQNGMAGMSMPNLFGKTYLAAGEYTYVINGNNNGDVCSAGSLVLLKCATSSTTYVPCAHELSLVSTSDGVSEYTCSKCKQTLILELGE